MKTINPMSTLNIRESSVHKVRLQEHSTGFCAFMKSAVRESASHSRKANSAAAKMVLNR